MVSKKMLEALNEQINAEIYSSYLYLAMAAYFDSLTLKGHANWMRVQAQEELVHAVRFYTYINDRNGRVTLKAIACPPAKWDSPCAVFEATYEHEQKVTARINKLAALAAQEKDPVTGNFLLWFLTEQVEEEANAKGTADKLRMVGDKGPGLFMVDQELATRVFVMPPAGGAAPAAAAP